MRHIWQITIVGMALALAGINGPASAQPTRAYRYSQRYSHSYAGTAVGQHRRIVGSRRTHIYRVLSYRSQWPPSHDRVYFQSETQARAAGYRSGGQDPVPVQPQLTWRGTRRQLPSLGKHKVAPQAPKDMEKPVAPPDSQQPPVTPTNPMPN